MSKNTSYSFLALTRYAMKQTDRGKLAELVLEINRLLDVIEAQTTLLESGSDA